MYMFLVSLVFLVVTTEATDITHQVFGSLTDGIPSAFGDFNSDEITDVFITRNNARRVEVLLGSYENEPFLKEANLFCDFPESSITSVVPGDFNGDAIMDVLVTVKRKNRQTLHAHVLWGGLNVLNCSNETDPVIRLRNEPVALDYNNDFIIDLFGLDEDGRRTFWVFKNDTKIKPEPIPAEREFDRKSIRPIHSNAFLDLNNDNIADLFVTGEKDFEIWERDKINSEFKFKVVIPIPKNESIKITGQSVFLDVESIGNINHILPVTTENHEPKIFVSVGNHDNWIDLKVNFEHDGAKWHFFPLSSSEDDLPFMNSITLRSGDYNMDGYPDLLATLISPVHKSRTFLLENVPCVSCDNFTRTFEIRWEGFAPENNETVLGVFFDIFQDGILDVILIEKTTSGDYRTVAYKNNLDNDANFVKVMVLTGLTNDKMATIISALGNRKRTFGTNLPGPKISCKTLDQDGNTRESVSAQIPQSAHYSLNSPYNMFGLGRTPNFVDFIGVGFASKSKEWPQLIPNSQMLVIPNPIGEPSKWKMQLFVTPSKVILMSFASLVGTCFVICVIIAILHWNEKKRDRLERQQEPYRFHFDAM